MVVFLDKVMNRIILGSIIILLLIGSYPIISHIILQNESDESQYEHMLDENGEPNFDKLKAINPEIVGWIRVKDTKINYPICQSTDNSKYVNTNAYGKRSLSGSIFLDFQNSADFSDYYNILYGHEMAGDKMFGGLEHFKNQDYLNSHTQGTLYYPGGKKQIEIFSGIATELSDRHMFTPLKESDPIFASQIVAKSLTYRDVYKGERVLALTTCNQNETNGRTIVLAKILD